MRYLLFLLFYSVLGSVFCQTTMYNAFIEAENVWNSDKENYYNPVQYLEQVNLDSLNSIETNIYLDALATFSSFASDFDKTQQCNIARRMKYYKPKADAETKDTEFLNSQILSAKAEIIKLANKHDVIMINEAHHIPYHRNLVSSLLEGLKKEGYRYLALEGLKLNHQINERGYPCFEDGFYTKESLFGEMIRKAIQLDYTLVAYEPNEKCADKENDKYYCRRFRDSLQAENIYKVKKEDKGAKIVVLAGYSHIKEQHEPHKTRMAEYYKRISGTDPLTIDQTTMLDFGKTELLNPYYKSIMNQINDEPAVLLSDNKLWSHSEQIDITVFSPKLKKKNNRFLFYAADHKLNFLPKIKKKETHFVQAFYRKEKGDNIPADQFYVDAEPKYLYLNPGKYWILLRNKNGELLKKYRTRIR